MLGAIGLYPIPAWVLGVVYVGTDVLRGLNPNSDVAVSAHFGGLLFGYLFYRTGFQLGRLIPGGFSFAALRRRPKIRLHDPGAGSKADEELDRILAKISSQGEGSLTDKERRTLKEASRRYQQRR